MATRLVSGNRIVEVTMNTWDGEKYTPDWSNDFFMVGSLRYDVDLEAYEVDDIDYCIEQAEDWKNKVGDYYGEEDVEGVERNVDVDEVDFPPMTKDGEYLNVGNWISDSTGIYEVTDVSANRIEAREVIFDEDNADDYHLDTDRSIFTNDEIRRRFEFN